MSSKSLTDLAKKYKTDYKMPQKKKSSSTKRTYKRNYSNNNSYARRYYKAKYTPRKRFVDTKGGLETTNKLIDLLGPLAPALLGGVGSMLGPVGTAIGSGLGSIIATKAGALTRSISGYGDYKVSVNTLMAADSVPEFTNVSARCTMVKHREFIGDVIGGALVNSFSAFTINTYPIQPGNAQTFPWLSLIAQNYEQYRFHGLIFEFKTTSGAISSSPMLGTVVMATQYNSLAPVFTNKQEMENYEFAASTVPSQSLIHPIECDPKQTQCNGIFNVATNENFFGGDKRLYDMGDFSLATVGMPVANQVSGELWVSYDVCLMKPRLNPGSGNSADHWEGVGTSFSGGTQYFGTDAALTANSDSFTALTGTTITFNKGFYGNVMVQYALQYSATGGPFAGPNMTGSNGATAFNIYRSGTNGYNIVSASSGVANTIVSFYFTVQPVSSGLVPTITLSGGTFGTVQDMDLLIIQLPGDFS